MAFKVKGKIGGKNYMSRKKFSSESSALKFAYSKVYTASGNKKRKNRLSDFSVVKAKKKK